MKISKPHDVAKSLNWDQLLFIGKTIVTDQNSLLK